MTRAFDDAALGSAYRQSSETLMPRVTLHRLRSTHPGYLPKEEIHRDLDVLTHVLTHWLRSLPRLPDILHAHYADAGVLALRMRHLLRTPFVFTAHSLGADKARWLESVSGHPWLRASLERRIIVEQQGIDHADGIVASSAHEAREQYGLYRHHESSRQKSAFSRVPNGAGSAH